ncbi:MAG: hypothetical protein V3S69_01780, partial [Dehalococcoidales bacterium]
MPSKQQGVNATDDKGLPAFQIRSKEAVAAGLKILSSGAAFGPWGILAGAVLGLVVTSLLITLQKKGNFFVNIGKTAISSFLALSNDSPFASRNLGRTILELLLGPLGTIIADMTTSPSFTAAFADFISPKLTQLLRQGGIPLKNLKFERGGEIKQHFQDRGLGDPFEFQTNQDLQQLLSRSGRISAADVSKLSDVLFAFGVAFSGGESPSRTLRAGILSANVAMEAMLANMGKFRTFDFENMMAAARASLGSFEAVVVAIDSVLEIAERKEKQIDAEVILGFEAALRGAALIFKDDFPKGIDVASKAIRLMSINGRLDMEALHEAISAILQVVQQEASEIVGEPFKQLLEGKSIDVAFDVVEDKFADFLDKTLVQGFTAAVQQMVVAQGILTPIVDFINEAQLKLLDGTMSLKEFGVQMRKIVSGDVIPGFQLLAATFDEVFTVLASTVGLPLERIPDFFGNFNEQFGAFLKFEEKSRNTTFSFKARFAQFSAAADARNQAQIESDFFANDGQGFREELLQHQKLIDRQTGRNQRDIETIMGLLTVMVTENYAQFILDSATDLKNKQREALERGTALSMVNDEELRDIATKLTEGESVTKVHVANFHTQVEDDNSPILMTGNLREGLTFEFARLKRNTPAVTTANFDADRPGIDIEAIVNRGESLVDARAAIDDAMDFLVGATGLSRKDIEDRLRETQRADGSFLLGDDETLADIFGDPERLAELVALFGDEFALAAQIFADRMNVATDEVRASIARMVESVKTPEEFVAAFSVLNQALTEGLITVSEFRRLLFGGEELPFSAIVALIVADFNAGLETLFRGLNLDEVTMFGDPDKTIAEEILAKFGFGDLGDVDFQKQMEDVFGGEFTFEEIINDFDKLRTAMLALNDEMTEEDFMAAMQELFATTESEFTNWVQETFQKPLDELTLDEFEQAIKDFFGEGQLDLATILVSGGLLPQ